MATLTQAERAREKRAIWTFRNKGVLTKIATETGFSQPHVSDVFHGRRTNEVIAAKLAENGAPGFAPE